MLFFRLPENHDILFIILGNNMIKQLFAIVGIGIMLAACHGVTTPSRQASSHLTQIWQLESVSQGYPVPHNAFLDLRALPKASANMGCNQMSIQLNEFSGSLKAEQMMSTRMYCEEFASLEIAFSKALNQGVTVEQRAHQLVLRDKQGNVWQFKAK